MKPNSKKRSANKSGAVLVTAVAVLIIMSILMTATIGYVTVNRKKTNSNYMHKQAYLTASTTLKGFVTQIEKETAKPGDGTSATPLEQKEKINKLKALAAANGGKGTPVPVTYNGSAETDYRIGTTTLTISQENGNADTLVLTAVTTYGTGDTKVTEKVAAHFSIDSKRKPVDFTNTIETIGDSDQTYWDNLMVIGDTAILNDKGAKTYTFKNDTNPQGSFYIWGNVIPNTAGSVFRLSKNLIDTTRGSFAQISGDFTGELKCTSTEARQDGYNYFYVGGAAKVNRNSWIGMKWNGAQSFSGYETGKMVDLITHKLESSGNGYTQYGNIYVHKHKTSATLDGSVSFTGSGMHPVIYGDMYVEGNVKIDCPDFKMYNPGGTGKPKVYVAGSIDAASKAKIEAGGGEVVNVTSIDWGERGAIPKMESTSVDYKYYPEDLVKGSDSDIAKLKSAFASLCAYDKKNGTYEECKKWSKLTRGNYTVDGNKFDYKVTENSIMDTGLQDTNTSVIVNVTNSDIVILMEDGLFLQNGFNIIVKNDSPIVTNEDGTKDHKYTCYFVSDMDRNGTLNCPGTFNAPVAGGSTTPKGVSDHTGSTASTYNFRKFRVFDYDMYIKMFSAATRAAGSVTDHNVENTKFCFNASTATGLTIKDGGSVVTDAEVYDAKSSSIQFLLGEGTTFSATNNSLIQAVIYGPQSHFQMYTQGISKFSACDAAGDITTSKNLGVMGIGVFIVQKFDSDNTGYYIYTKPSAQSALSGTKDNKANNMNGFVLNRYAHY